MLTRGCGELVRHLSVWNLFNEIDIDGSGLLDVHEIQLLIEKLGAFPTRLVHTSE